jgi:hypothetical protein
MPTKTKRGAIIAPRFPAAEQIWRYLPFAFAFGAGFAGAAAVFEAGFAAGLEAAAAFFGAAIGVAPSFSSLTLYRKPDSFCSNNCVHRVSTA